MRPVIPALLGVLTACSGQPLELRGDHLHLVGTTRTTSAEEMASLLELGEQFHGKIASLQPPGVTLDPEVRVELHGAFRSESPYVDEDGTLHLWSFQESQGGYRAMFAHELVHAIAYDTGGPGAQAGTYSGFYNEGWAEYAALTVDPDKTGFPLFGFPEDVVVGHWLKEPGPSLATLRENHEAMNMKCQYQGYIQRASWYRYVDETLGRPVLLRLLSAPEGHEPAALAKILGKPLADVDAEWKAWALQRYAARADADAEAAAFRERVYWVEPCEG